MIPGVQYVNPAEAVMDQRPRVVELSLVLTVASPTTERPAFPRKALDAVIAELGNVNGSVRGQDQVIRIIKLAW